MPKMTMPVRRDRARYRSELTTFLAEPGPYLSLFLDVRAGAARDQARQRLLGELDRVVRTAGQNLSAEQWSAAGDVLGLVEADDATLVSFIDPAGQALTTGYGSRPDTELVTLADQPLVAPLLAAEQALVHHIVADIGQDRLWLRTAPRHGQASEMELEIDHAASLPAIIQRSALLSRTAMVVLRGSSQRLAEVSATVRAALPVEVRLATVEIDGLTAEQIESALADRLTTELDRKATELVSLWGFHHVHDEAVDGIDEVTRAVAEGRAGLLLMGKAIATPGGPEPAAPGAGELIWSSLGRNVPVHLLPGDHADPFRDGVGAILADQVDPAQLAALLEH